MEILLEKIGKGEGSYVIVASLKVEKLIKVGKIGCLNFPAGFYAYAGSALGPGGLAARIGHHLKTSRKPHWHMDYFGKHADFKQAWVFEGKECSEHDLARLLSRSGNCPAPVKGFGCSDCNCFSHLYRFETMPDVESFKKGVKKVAPGSAGLRRILLCEG